MAEGPELPAQQMDNELRPAVAMRRQWIPGRRNQRHAKSTHAVFEATEWRGSERCARSQLVVIRRTEEGAIRQLA